MSARFAPGDRVRITDRDPPGHYRTPRYVRGREGVIERVCGDYGQPELLAYGGDGKPFRTLYRVHLDQTDLWPGYAGSAHDSLELEIFEHWLDPA